MSGPTPHNRSTPDSSVRAGRIIVVGPCAAGKSTLVSALCALGYDAHPCAQEHSEIATLWRHSQPDLLIALKVDLGAVRSRRGEDWPAWLYEIQARRLTKAYASADLVIDASRQDASAVLDAVVAYLEYRALERA